MVEGLMTGGKSPRRKGDRVERAVVKFLQQNRFAAERIPLSGAAGGSFAGDISVPVLGVDRIVEVKARANGFRELYRWLEGRDLLIVKADRSEPLVVVPLRLAVEIAGKAEEASR
jgi:Holliday junction resolvase